VRFHGLLHRRHGLFRVGLLAPLRLTLESVGIRRHACGERAYFDRRRTGDRLRHRHTLGRSNAQLLADPDYVGIVDIVPGGNVTVILTTLLSNFIQRIAAFNCVITGAGWLSGCP